MYVCYMYITFYLYVVYCYLCHLLYFPVFLGPTGVQAGRFRPARSRDRGREARGRSGTCRARGGPQGRSAQPAQDSLQQSLAMMPQNALVGFITFGARPAEMRAFDRRLPPVLPPVGPVRSVSRPRRTRFPPSPREFSTAPSQRVDRRGLSVRPGLPTGWRSAEPGTEAMAKKMQNA